MLSRNWNSWHFIFANPYFHGFEALASTMSTDSSVHGSYRRWVDCISFEMWPVATFPQWCMKQKTWPWEFSLPASLQLFLQVSLLYLWESCKGRKHRRWIWTYRSSMVCCSVKWSNQLRLETKHRSSTASCGKLSFLWPGETLSDIRSCWRLDAGQVANR